MIERLLYIIISVTLLASLGTAIYKAKWWTRFFDVTQVYITLITAALLLILFIFITPWGVAGTLSFIGLLLTLILHLSKLLPYTILYPIEVPKAEVSSGNFRLLTINILQDNRQQDALQVAIDQYQPDLLFITEYSPFWESHTQDLEAIYPYKIGKAKRDYGLALYSKYPFQNAELRYLEVDVIPSVHAVVRLNEAMNIYVIGVHPSPPLPWGISNTAEKDSEILEVAKLAAESTLPVVVTGDFNDVSWSKLMQAFKRKSQLKDPRVGRGFFNTFHAMKPWMRYPIDHIFLSSKFQVKDFQRVKVKGSDHFGLYVEVYYNEA